MKLPSALSIPRVKSRLRQHLSTTFHQGLLSTCSKAMLPVMYGMLWDEWHALRSDLNDLHHEQYAIFMCKQFTTPFNCQRRMKALGIVRTTNLLLSVLSGGLNVSQALLLLLQRLAQLLLSPCGARQLSPCLLQGFPAAYSLLSVSETLPMHSCTTCSAMCEGAMSWQKRLRTILHQSPWCRGPYRTEVSFD